MIIVAILDYFQYQFIRNLDRIHNWQAGICEFLAWKITNQLIDLSLQL